MNNQNEMEQLPIELIEKILISDILVIQDVVNFSLTSKYFQQLIRDSNTIWKTKFFQRFPGLWNKLENKPVACYNELCHIYLLKNRTRSILDDMAQKFYKKVELSNDDLKEWENIIREKWDNYFYLVVDLMDIIHTKCDINTRDLIPVNIPGNLTQKYYAAKVLRFIRQIYLERMWGRYLRKPLEHRLLENGALLVAQWCQPDIEIENEAIYNSLDEITKMVESELKTICPEHPFFKATKEQRELWKSTARPDNEWGPRDCCFIICAINEVLFNQLRFMCYSDQTATLTLPEESYFFIDVVLKTRKGMREILAIIYEAVSRRLGLRCDLIFISSHFFLRFCENQHSDADWYYIDVSRGGQIVKRGSCPFSKNMSTGSRKNRPGYQPEEVIVQITKELEYLTRQTYSPSGRITKLRSMLELTQLVNPKDIRALIGLATLYMQHNFSTDTLNSLHDSLSRNTSCIPQVENFTKMIQDYMPDPPDDPITPVLRSPDNSVKFAVGMVMGHKLMQYKCVIFNWDPKCLAVSDWKQRNNIDGLKYKDNQPFYNVLVEDNSHRYVAQENLYPIHEPQGLRLDDEVGRYFSHYYQTYYVPNVQTEYHFPEDAAVRNYYHKDVHGIPDQILVPISNPA